MHALDILSGAIPTNFLNLLENKHPIKMQGTGKIIGKLMAGNLTIITTLLGTPYLPDLQGAILLVEDINEPAHRVDRLFFHLRNSGVYDQISALIVGDFGFSDDPYATSFLNTSVLESTRGFDFPIILNIPYGHGEDRLTLPVGAEMILDSDNMSLTLSPNMIRALSA